MPLGGLAGLIAVVTFLAGVLLVIESVEVFVESVSDAAMELGVSGFFLTILLAGTDLENAVLGVVAAVGRLPDVAIGTVFGEALFIIGAALGVTAFLAPFESDVPWRYVAIMLVSPLLFFWLAGDGGLTAVDGLVLTAAFVPGLGLIYHWESLPETQYLSKEEEASLASAEEDAFMATDEGDETGDIPLAEGEGGEFVEEALERVGIDVELDLPASAVAILAVIGMTVGSELAVLGARELLVLLGITGLAFGATIMSFIASIEELALTLEPVRKGRPHLAVGNVVGSMVFFVTANAGVIALAHPIGTGGWMLVAHVPFLAGSLVLVGGLLLRGRFGRVEGVVLMGLYVGYWVLNYPGLVPFG